jgi:hypothetical protein
VIFSLAVLCSRRCPAPLVVAGLDWAVAVRTCETTVVSGFQSPLEKEALKFLLKGSVRLVVCPARSAVGMRIPAEYKKAMTEGRLTIRSFIDKQATADSQRSIERPTSRSVGTTTRTPSTRTLPKRPTTDLAEQRNRFACSISDAVLILHASAGGKLERLASELLAAGKRVWTLDDPANASLIASGARPLNPKSGIESLFTLDARQHKVS